MFIGRKKELDELENYYDSQKSELVVIYGRRRIGKLSLVKTFAGSKSYFYEFEAVESASTKKQIRHFTDTLAKQAKDPFLQNISFRSWEDLFAYLSDRIVQKRNRKKADHFF